MLLADSHSWTQSFSIASIAFTCWLACLYTYRLTLHPLARFPGPRLAAITGWYEFYYDVVLKGQYVFRLRELHKVYGPIIRISPWELHIDDPDFFDILYARSGRLHRDERHSQRFGGGRNVFLTPDATVHRMRRAALNPFFSKRNVLSFQHVVQAKVRQMLLMLRSYRETEMPVTISLGYMALVGDVIMEYCFGYNFDHVGSKDFSTNFHDFISKSSQTGNLAVHFPIVTKIIMNLPEWIVIWGMPMYAPLLRMTQSVAQDVRILKRQEQNITEKPKHDHPHVLQHLVGSELPPEEKEELRLIEESTNFIGAGVSTTGWALSVATFHIINNRCVYQTLKRELEAIIPDPQSPDALDFGRLEKCEYLTACIKEGIRLAPAIAGRSIRVSDDYVQYQQWHIPPKISISMSVPDLSHNEDIFPDSEAFKPERWLGDAKTKRGEPVENYWFGFSRGNRNCLGMHLAWLELYVSLAGVFRNLDFQLFETDQSDVTMMHDFMIPSPKLDSKGVRVLVK